MQPLKASLLEPLLALHDATSAFAFASAALTQFPVASFCPYFARNTAVPSAFTSALQNEDATLAAPSSPFEPDDFGGAGAFGACALTQLPSISVFPYFAMKASAPIFRYSALHAATAGESESDDFAGACALTQLPSVSVFPYFAMKASAPIFRYSALHAATAAESESAGLGCVFGALKALRQLPYASLAPYFALNASAPSLRYSALHAAVAGSSSEVVVVGVVTAGACAA